MSPTRNPTRPLTLLAIAATGVILAALLGAVTNAVNGWVYPGFFLHIWGWWPLSFSLWQAAVAQGILEGLLFGAAFSLIYTTGVGVITRAKYGFAVRRMGWIVLGSLGGWALGGFAGLGLVLWNPDWYRSLAPNAPWLREAMLAHAWVLGSIWGIEFGGLVSVVLGLVILRADWRNVQPSPADAVSG